MCVVNHGYGGMGVARDGGGGWYAYGTKLVGWTHVGRYHSTSMVLHGRTVDINGHAIKEVELVQSEIAQLQYYIQRAF